MDSFSLLLFLTPLLVYMAVTSLIRLSGNIHTTTAGREIVAVALAVSGMITVGPVELFFPMAAASVFGPVVWGILALFYALCVSLIVIGSTPKIIVYGITAEELLDPLLAAARTLDQSAEAARDGLQIYLPASGVHLRISPTLPSDHASILAFEENISPKFWHLLRIALRDQLKSKRTNRYRGIPLAIATLLLGLFLVLQVIQFDEKIAKSFQTWFWR